jgi:hypothetical protein
LNIGQVSLFFGVLAALVAVLQVVRFIQRAAERLAKMETKIDLLIESLGGPEGITQGADHRLTALETTCYGFRKHHDAECGRE